MTLEQAQERILELEEQLQVHENIKSELNNANERIKALELHNQKLFLKATSSFKEDVENKDKEFKSDILGEYASLLSDDEIELFKELEE